MNIKRIDFHVSSNAWCDGADVSDIDEAASFQGWMTALHAALSAEYPEAVIRVYTHPNDLKDRLDITTDEDWNERAIDDVHEHIEREIIGRVWEQGHFWVLLDENTLEILATLRDVSGTGFAYTHFTERETP